MKIVYFYGFHTWWFLRPPTRTAIGFFFSFPNTRIDLIKVFCQLQMQLRFFFLALLLLFPFRLLRYRFSTGQGRMHAACIADNGSESAHGSALCTHARHVRCVHTRPIPMRQRTANCTFRASALIIICHCSIFISFCAPGDICSGGQLLGIWICVCVGVHVCTCMCGTRQLH